MKTILLLFCVMFKFPWVLNRVYCKWGLLQLWKSFWCRKKVHLEKQQCWAHVFPGKLNDQHEVPQVSAKFILINSCTLLPVNSVLESQQTAVLFISWHLVFNTFFTHTTWRSQKWISESAHVLISKWVETNSNIWSISSFLNFKRYVLCHTKLSVNYHR